MQLPRPKMRSFWRRPARTAVAAVEIDPADMGTCFGLEMSLDRPLAVVESSPSSEPRHWWERSGVRRAFGA